MKCLLVSDLHYALKQYDWTMQVAADFDVVIIAGDHLDIAGHVDFRAQSVVMLKYFARLNAKSRLIVSSGNHDLDARNAAGEKIVRWIHQARRAGVPTDGDAVMIDGTLITICPWWDGPIVHAEIDAQLRRDAEREKRRWIWVYHAPPDHSPTSWVGDRYEGDEDLVRWIEAHSPDLVLSGHIHESPFKRGGSWVDRIGKTWVFNAGRQIGEIPAHVIFDTAHERAAWFSLAGAETVCLDGPLRRPVEALSALPDWLRA